MSDVQQHDLSKLASDASVIESNIDSRRDDTNLVKHPKFEGISFFKSSYQGKDKYYAVLPTTAERSGIRAFAFSGPDTIIFPIYNDLQLIKAFLPAYKKASFLLSFAKSKEELSHLKSALTDFSTLFGYQGDLKVSKNQPGPKLAKSWTLIISANEKLTADPSKTADFASKLTDVDWDSI